MVINRTDKHDVIERGQALYERTVRAQVEPAHNDHFVVLDVESGEYEVDADKLAALDRLIARLPGAVPYIVRAGHATAVNLGGAGLRVVR